MTEPAPFRELQESAPYQLVERKSRFLAELFPARTLEEARERVADQRRKYPDATHVVHATVLGERGEIQGCSDDGEPAGTAGRPVLEILKGTRLTQVVLLVTRWFGGTKLGTGGLVHAYGDAARGVLASAVTRPRIPTVRGSFSLPFSLAELGRRTLPDHAFTLEKEEFSAQGVTFHGSLPAENAPALEKFLRELTRGKTGFQLSS
ncbi:MAG: IMPACT family protein [Oligosphaeraceae bacterium]